MNHSLYSADRATHLKIVAVALLGACLVAGVGVAARLSESALEARAPVIKVGGPVILTSSEVQAVR